MKITKSQLREIIREEIQNLTERITDPLKKGDFVSFVDVYRGEENKWYITYIDSTHVYLSLDKPTPGGSKSGFSIYHIRQLSDKSYYKDMVKWIESGNKKHINGKKYNG
jgi:hypothetical protein